MKKILLLFSFLAIMSVARGATPTTYDFAVVDGDTLRMDVYMPGESGAAPRAAVLFAFGGGFKGGSRNYEEYREFFDFLSDNGVVAISTDYRTTLVSRSTPSKLGSVKGFAEAMWGAVTDAVTDFYTATGFVLRHASEWGIDPAKIIASGSSAGAITALQAEYGLANGMVPAGIFPAGFNYAATISFAGAICVDSDLKWKTTPCPMMLFHGDADRNVPYASLPAGKVGLCGSKTIAGSLIEMNVPVEFYTVAGADHSVAISPMHDNLYAILGFVCRIRDGKQRTSLEAMEFVPGAPTDYQTSFSIKDYIEANM